MQSDRNHVTEMEADDTFVVSSSGRVSVMTSRCGEHEDEVSPDESKGWMEGWMEK
ncbi:hypothetical protein FQN60_015464, partial [Etheostoma spectabile]